MIANVSVRDTEKELNITREQIYAKYTELLPDQKSLKKNKIFAAKISSPYSLISEF